MARLTIKDLPLEELYARPKITSSVAAVIALKEDFSKVQSEYCNKVCTLACKSHGQVRLQSKHYDIVFIQDHPAIKGKYDRSESQQEVIMQGIIRRLTQDAGFGNLTYAVLDLVKCPNNSKNFPKNKSPTSVVMSKCAPYLLAELERIKPKVIVSLTTTVTKVLGYKKHSNTGNRGEIVGGNVVISLHPKALTMIRQNASGKMWSYDYYEVIRRDFEKAAKIARGELKVIPLLEGVERQKNNVSVCNSIESVKAATEFLASLSGTGAIVSFDTETNSLDPHSEGAKLITCQFGWRDADSGVLKAVVIPLWHRENRFYDPDEAWKLVEPLLLDPELYKVMHNGKFDYLFVYHTRHIRIQGFKFDTMLLIHDLDSGAQGTYSLKAAIWDFAPELGLGGYENLLPGLTKKKKGGVVGEDSEGTNEEESEVDSE